MNDLKDGELISSSVKDNLEYYNVHKTPSYVVRKFENAIVNDPIIESYLLHQDLVSLTSNRHQSSLRKCSQRPMTSPCWTKDQVVADQQMINKMHIYLAPTEIVSENISSENISLGKPTRTTLLRTRMNWSDFLGNKTRIVSSAKRGCVCCKSDTAVRPKTGATVSSCQGGSGGINYAFLVGARYNCSRFINQASSKVKPIPRILLENNGTESIDTEFRHNLSHFHPNSPQSPQMSEQRLKMSSIKDLKTQSENENKELVSSRTLSSDKSGGNEVSSPRPASQLKTCPLPQTSLPSSSFRSRVLPVVYGEKCYSKENVNDNSSNSIPKTCWTKASLNRHFARQSRNLRNRRQAHTSNTLKQLQVNGISTSKLSNMQIQ